MGFDRLLTLAGERFIAGGTRAVPCGFAGAREGFFHLEQQGVKIDRHDTGGADRAKLLRIIHPARAEIPAGRRARAQIAVDVSCRAIRVIFGGGYVIKPGFGTRRVAIVPVAVQHRAIFQFHHALVGIARRQIFAAFHPVGVLFLQLRQIFFQRLVAAFMARQQFNHKREERRLGAA